jgi:hypothetical protein
MKHLHDYLTGERLGIATDEQIVASESAGETGAILINSRTGAVITVGSWAASTADGSRTVYTAWNNQKG